MVYESNEINLIKLQDGTDGKPGKDGESGKTLYTWVKYSQYADGTDMTDDPTNAVYIGISYNNETPTESPDKTLYTWAKIKGDDGQDGKTPVKGVDYFDGQDGQPGKDGTSYYTHIRYSANSDGSGFVSSPTSSTVYIGVYTGISSTAPTSASSYSWSKYVGDKGATGNGINSITYYYATTTTQTAPSASSITSTSIPTLSPTNKYLWQKEVIDYTDSSVADKTSVILLAVYGDTGSKGDAGTSVTISSTSVTYQASSSGTTTPTGTWSSSVPTVTNGQYLWTKTVVNYSDGKSTTSYSVAYKGTNGKDGTDGTDGSDGRGIKSTSTTYQTSTSGTTVPTGTWSSSIPSVSAGSYLWTRTIVTYTDSTTSTSYSVGMMGATGAKGDKGNTGDTGTGVSKVIPLYYLKSNTTAPSAPTSAVASTSTSSGVWTTAIPTYVSGYTYFTCTQTLYTDGTYKWSTVVIDNGLTNANSNAYTANSNASSALSTANSANNKATYHYGTCSTAAATVAKVVTLSGFTLYTGATVTVYFTYANTASNPTLNVNGTGAKNIRVKNANITKPYYWGATDTVTFTYNGSYWVMSDTSANAIIASWCYNSDTTYINGGTIAAKTITAREIAAKTITADKLNVDNLASIVADIGLWHIEDGKLVADITKESIDDEYEILRHSVISYEYNSGEISLRKQRDTVINNDGILVEYVESTNDRYTTELYPGATSQSLYDRYTKYSDNQILYLEQDFDNEINVSANIIFDKVITGKGYSSIIKLIADNIELDASNSANGVSVNGTFQADEIMTSSGANLDTINSNLSDCIKYLGTYTFSMTVQSTKSLGRGQEYTVTLDKNYPTARFGIINQDINGDWVIINLKAWKDTQHPVLTYQNFYSSALSGNVSIHIYGY